MIDEGELGIRSVPDLSPAEQAAAVPADTSQDERAIAESKIIASGLSQKELEERQKRTEFERTERFRDHFEWIAVIGLYVTAIALALIVGIWVWHLIAPYPWLSSEQFSRLQSFVTGGIVVGLAGGHIKKRLGS